MPASLYGPLTTIFSPPCGTVARTSWGSHPSQLVSSSCLPPGYFNLYQDGYDGAAPSMGWYSPGVCPDGYTVGTILPNNYKEDQGTLLGLPTRPTETAGMCMPTGYTLRSGDWDFAMSSKSVSFTSTDYYYALMIQIRWASVDIPILETHPLTPGLKPTSSTSSTTSTAPASSTSSAAPTDASPGGAYSSGTLAGVAVGLLVAGLLLGAAFLWVFLRIRRRKKRAPATYLSEEEPAPAPRKAEVASTIGQPATTDEPAMVSRLTLPTATPGTAQHRGSPAAQELDYESRVGREGPFEMAGHHPEYYGQPLDIAPAEGSPSASPVETPVEALQRRQVQIEARRSRLRELQDLEDEEERIRQQIAEMHRASR